MFKTKVESQLTVRRRRAVSLQSFEYCDVISIVDKSTDHGKLLSICFLTLTVLTTISFEVSRKIAHAKKRKRTYATITPFPWSVVLSSIALDQSAREKYLSYGKILTECHHIR